MCKKVKGGDVIQQSDCTVCTMEDEELGKVHEQLSNYQYRLVKAVGKACNMRRRRVYTSAHVGRQSVRSFSVMENRFLSTYLLN